MHARALKAAGLCLALAAGACERPAPELTLALALRAADDADQPVAGTRFWLDGHALGETGESGVLRSQARGRVGAQRSLTAACPPAYRTAREERRIVIAELAGTPAIHILTRCQPLTRQAALVISTEGAAGAALPVVVDGRTVGQLAPDGTAHLLLSAAPYSVLRVTLDTGESALTPSNPVQSFQLADADSILLFEQSFSRRRPRAPRQRLTTPPRRPYRLR